VGGFVERVTSATATGYGPPGTTSWTANLRLAVVATPGDRREEDMRELGAVAARYFDDVIVREDKNPRGRQRGETAAHVAEGVREAMNKGARAGSLEVVLDEMDAVRKALDRSRPGDLVVLCVDEAAAVWREMEGRRARHRPLAEQTGGDGHAVGEGTTDLIEFEVGL
jgi:cyanophycin synthetase